MPKNTLKFVSALAVIAALLVGINIGRSMNRQDAAIPSPTPILTPTPTPGLVSGSACGVTYRYPNSLTPMESTASGVILADIKNPESSIIIACQTDIPRVPLTPDRIETMTISGGSGPASVSARLYHDASAKDGTPIDKLIFSHPTTGLDVFIAGFGPVFNALIATVSLR